MLNVYSGIVLEIYVYLFVKLKNSKITKTKLVSNCLNSFGRLLFYIVGSIIGAPPCYYSWFIRILSLSVLQTRLPI